MIYKYASIEACDLEKLAKLRQAAHHNFKKLGPSPKLGSVLVDKPEGLAKFYEYYAS